MKVIKRNYYEYEGAKLTLNGRFINTGIWADGHLAYSRLDENGNRIEDEEGRYAQIRENGKLVMLGI